jgi:hypothetical protein
MAHAFHPYYRMKNGDKAVYPAKMDGGQPRMEWVDE